MSEGESGQEKPSMGAQELKQAISKLGMRDRVIFLGSAVLVLLFFLPWWKVEMGGMSRSVSGLTDAAWIGFIAAVLSTVAGLANMGFIPLTGQPKELAGKTVVQVGLAAVALFLGPIYFWGHTNQEGGEGMMAPGFSIGKTFFFWLALLAALAVAGAAVWKLVDERKAAAGGPTTGPGAQ
jgi:hypothetical protein